MKAIKRWISISCAVAFSALNFCGMSVAAESAVWDGTCDTDWYHNMKRVFYIETPEELAGLASLVNSGITMEGKTIHLMSDILLNDTDNFESWLDGPPANVWTPIGTSDNPFYGTFDGHGFTVDGMYISTTEIGSYGLFGYTRDSQLKNVDVDNSYIMIDSEYVDSSSIDDASCAALSVGGLCGHSVESEISKCTYQGIILANVNWKYSLYYTAGGICGSGIVKKCAVIEYPKSWIGRSQAAL